ncbi:GLPGLI family protein [Elizabethkingia miricola]|nr:MULTISPECIES: GLPGLI family protein [Elizabethkingia]MCL1652145.1 GLPGLI family protein [Elizabethkingia miricola]OPC69293.1 GLPGLI family protein [Elizabethkingia miricola]OPC71831.1 GLPGLI family protein [Elizabethkingia miricola]QCO46892.1 GLPGLI family protein [Elizabethkingia sp. 2-6]SPW29918.1 GLPGLI family protein [Elizabethkingia miricola]
MKTLQLFIFCISTLYFTQNIRFVYQVQMKTDSTQRDQVKSELANLDIDKTNSVFYAAKAILRDSIMEANEKSRIGYLTEEQVKMMISNIGYRINKNYRKQDISFISAVAGDNFIYNELKPFNWKITTETKKIGAYNTQKATTQYGGRDWEIWFTTEVPFQDGPYKFCGLPGLIVKAEDSKGDYQFELVEARKISDIYKAPSPWKQIVKVKKEEYNKVYKRFIEDPVAFLPPPPVNVNGTTVNPNTNATKVFKDKVTSEIRHYNNPIELN